MSIRTELPIAAAQITVESDLVPTALLTAQADIGSTSLSVDDVRRFRVHAIGSFWDGQTEFFDVSAVSPSGRGNDPVPVPGTLTLSYAGQPRSGLQFQHGSGALLATNVLDMAPVQTVQMLSNGFPVYAYFVLDSMDHMPTNMEWQEQGTLSLVYQLPAKQSGKTTMHPQLFLRQQVKRSEADITTLKREFRARSRGLVVGGTSQAEEIRRFVQALRPGMSDETTPTWETYVDIDLTGPLPIRS